MDKEHHRASRKSNLKIESTNTPEPPYGGAEAPAAFGSHRVARPRLSSANRGIAGVAPLKLKNETAIWNRRLAPRARA